MKFFRFIGTAIVLTVLCAAIALTLVSGALRFIALNPDYVKMFLPTKSSSPLSAQDTVTRCRTLISQPRFRRVSASLQRSP